MSDSLQPHGLQHERFFCRSLSLGVCSNSCLLNWWCYPTISSSATPFSFCLQSFPASWSFPVSQHFISGGQSIGTSASVTVLAVNTQGWFPLGLTGLISLQFKGLSRVFSSTTIWDYQFFGTQPSWRYITSENLSVELPGFFPPCSTSCIVTYSLDFILDLQKNQEDSMERSIIPLSSFPYY